MPIACPEQIWVLVFVADNQLSCGRDDFGLDHLVAGQTMLREAFGDEVIDHYVHTAAWEQFEYDRRVTDWELKRGFERY